jgi:hypothetical protein
VVEEVVMLLKNAIRGLIGAALFLALCFCRAERARADEWGQYYHWPYSNFNQYRWTPYEYDRIYDGNYKYPAHMRWYPQIDRWRNWATVKKPYYRGYHFILDQF